MDRAVDELMMAIERGDDDAAKRALGHLLKLVLGALAQATAALERIAAK